MKHKYTDQQFAEVVKKSNNIRQVCIQLGLSAYGGNYQVIKHKIKTMGLDVSHFGKKKTVRLTCRSLPLDILLTQGSYILNTTRLKEILLKSKMLQYKCYDCGKSTIQKNGEIVPIPLQLHHIDGDRNNNTINNLTLLCPICHSFTKNFRGKKKKQNIICQGCGKVIRKNKYGLCKNCYVDKYCSNPSNMICSVCGKKTKKTKSGLCRDCYNKKQTNPNKPSKQVLQKQVQQYSMLSLGRKYGVSDSAIRKWCQQYDIDYKHGIRKQSLQGLKKGRQTQHKISLLKKICPICGRKKDVTSQLCRLCYQEKRLKEKQDKYLKNSNNN